MRAFAGQIRPLQCTWAPQNDRYWVPRNVQGAAGTDVPLHVQYPETTIVLSGLFNDADEKTKSLLCLGFQSEARF